MELERRIKRDSEIVRLYEEGISCERIAVTVRLKSARIRRILKEKGYNLSSKPAAPHPIGATIWEREHFNLRAAITKRAAQAARTRLKEIAAEQWEAAISPLITNTNSPARGNRGAPLAARDSRVTDHKNDATYAQDVP